MTTQQPNLVSLARQGDPKAIAGLMNRSLQARGILAKVALQDGHLKIMLEGETVPEETVLVPYVQQGIVALNLPDVHTLQLYGRVQGTTHPSWTQTLSLRLEPVPSEVEPENEIASPETPEVQSESAIASSSKSPEVELASAIAADSAEPIAAHLNQALGAEGIVFTAQLSDAILKITAKTDQVLEGDTFAKSIREALLNLNLNNIDSVQVYKQKTRGNSCYKIKEFTLAPEAPTVQESTSQSTGAKAISAKRNSEGTAGAPTGAAHSIQGNLSSVTVDSRKPMRKVNETRKVLTLLAFIAFASFVVWLTLTRLSRWLLSPFGIISAMLSLPLLYKSYKAVFVFWQTFVRDDE